MQLIRKHNIYSFWFLFCFLLIFHEDLLGQSDIVMTHKWLSNLDHNPAAIVNDEYLNINLMGRYQWEIEGAPKSQILSASAFLEEYNSGIGLVVTNDKIGYIQTTTCKAVYSYQLHFDKKIAWSFGLSGGIINKSLDRQKVDMLDTWLDPELVGMEGSRLAPDFDFGTELVHPLFKIGASVNHLSALWDKNILATDLNNYLYFIGNIRVADKWLMSPGVYFVNHKRVNTVDVGLLFQPIDHHYRGNQILFWFGGNYRFSAKALSAMFGVHLSKTISLGYAFQRDMGALQSQDANTHELILRLRFQLYNKIKPCPALDAKEYWNERR